MNPTSVVLAVLVVTLLLPGLVMLTAIVVRFLIRGSGSAPRRGSIDAGGVPLPLSPPRQRAESMRERKD